MMPYTLIPEDTEQNQEHIREIIQELSALLTNDRDKKLLSRVKEALKDGHNKTLSLRWNWLYQHGIAPLYLIIQLLAYSNKACLDLTYSNLSEYKGDELVNALKELERTQLAEIDVSNNELYKLPLEKLIDIIHTLKHFEVVRMSDNKFDALDFEKFFKLLEQFKQGNTHTLNLSHNMLAYIGRYDYYLSNALRGLKGSGITSINLSDNELYHLKGYGLKETIKVLGEIGIESLQLSFTDILNIDDLDLNEVSKALNSTNITSLILSSTPHDSWIDYKLLLKKIDALKNTIRSLGLHFSAPDIPSSEFLNILTMKLAGSKVTSLEVKHFDRDTEILNKRYNILELDVDMPPSKISSHNKANEFTHFMRKMRGPHSHKDSDSTMQFFKREQARSSSREARHDSFSKFRR